MLQTDSSSLMRGVFRRRSCRRSGEWRRPRLVTRGHETPGPRPGISPVAWSLRARAGHAGDGSGPWPTAPRWSAERRPPGCAGGPMPRKRGVASATCSRLAPPGAPPTPRSGCCEEEVKNPAQDAGNEETALFDIVKMEGRERRIGQCPGRANRVGGNALGPGRGRASPRPREGSARARGGTAGCGHVLAMVGSQAC